MPKMPLPSRHLRHLPQTLALGALCRLVMDQWVGSIKTPYQNREGFGRFVAHQTAGGGTAMSALIFTPRAERTLVNVLRRGSPSLLKAL